MSTRDRGRAPSRERAPRAPAPRRAADVDRRALLRAAGAAGAGSLLGLPALLAALGCGERAPTPAGPAAPPIGVRAWLRDAVAVLAPRFAAVHALAVARRRVTGAVDVVGAGVARQRRDGAVLTARDRAGRWHERATSDLSAVGIAAAARALAAAGGPPQRTAVTFGPAPPPPPPLPPIGDATVRARVDAIAIADRRLNSRIVYAAAQLDVEDVHVWSISPHHDREARTRRVRQRALRAAWSGSRPVLTEAERGWVGGLDAQALARSAIEQATEDALLLVTPGALDPGPRLVILAPAVAASLADAVARARLVRAAPGGWAPAPDAVRLSPLLSITDDPTAASAYGGFPFDDEGAPAAPLVLVEAGRITGALGDEASGGRGRARRPGHLGALEPAPSHLRVAPGATPHAALREDGFELEGALGAALDPGSDRVVIGAARAREVQRGVLTGRVYADVELTGDATALLAAVSGVSAETAAVSYRDELDGEPRWRSLEAPHLRTRGHLRARRRGG